MTAIPAQQSSERQKLSVAQYRAEICCCGRAKLPRRSFCSACWHALPRPLQKPLVGTYGERYALAYFAAAEWLAARQRKEPA